MFSMYPTSSTQGSVQSLERTYTDLLWTNQKVPRDQKAIASSLCQ